LPPSHPPPTAASSPTRHARQACGEADQCNKGTCDPESGACAYEALPGQPCDLDGSVCTFDTCGAADAADGRSACGATRAALALAAAPREDTTFEPEAACASEAGVGAEALVMASLASDPFAEVSEITYTLNASAPYPLGSTPVLVTGTVRVSRAGQSGTCAAEAAATVVVVDEVKGGEHLQCGFPGKGANGVVMIPKGAATWSGAFTASYLEGDAAAPGVTAAGCPVAASVVEATLRWAAGAVRVGAGATVGAGHGVGGMSPVRRGPALALAQVGNPFRGRKQEGTN
jgi:hypothetical protein